MFITCSHPLTMIDLPTDAWVGVLINIFVEVLNISGRSDVKIDVLLNDVFVAVVGIGALTDVVVDTNVLVSAMTVLECTTLASEETIEIFLVCLAALSC